MDEHLVKEIKRLIKKIPKQSYDTGMDMVAKQEYVEAICLYEYLSHGTIPSSKSLGVDAQSYLCGIADLTGELVRKGVNSVIKGNIHTAKQITELVEEIYGAFLTFDLRNGELRKKSDQIKWNLTKLQDLMYDLTLKKQHS